MNTNDLMSKLLLITVALAVTGNAAPWHLPKWQARALVEISQPTGGSDTAAVKIVCQGRAKPDGSDYRVFDSTGSAVPFLLTYHDADHYSLISFRADNAAAGQRFWVYFMNPDATRAPEQAVIDPNPGSGPPTGAWTPNSGFVFAAMQRPAGPNPESVDELEILLAGSKRQYGARYQQQIAESVHSFGPTDYFISVYRGWVEIPAAGSYGFCTASNEASFSFLDGKELVHWPGRHTAERGLGGVFNTIVELTAGRHYLEYYHEEVMLEQLAFLGWSPPGTRADQYLPIPETFYTEPHSATVVQYEKQDGPLVRFEPILLDSIWPADRPKAQYTRVAFDAAGSPVPEGNKYEWSFGDGCTIEGDSRMEHVYMSMGDYAVTLRVDDQTVTWPLEVYEIRDITDSIGQGRPADYAAIVADYDLNKINANPLEEIIHLHAASDRPQDVLRTGKIFVERFGKAEKQSTASIYRLMALAALATGEAGIDEAIANFQASIAGDIEPTKKVDSIAQLIWLLGVEHKQPETTAGLLKQVEETVKETALTDAFRLAYRHAVNAAGDVAIWHGDRTAARGFYLRVEALRGHFIPPQVRSARVGAYPNAIRSYLQDGNYGAALGVVDEWEDKFATDKVKGHTFYWRGRVLAERHQHRNAARYLTRAIGLAAGAGFESEARWHLAAALDGLGRHQAARIELAKLVEIGMNDEYTRMAREKLQK